MNKCLTYASVFKNRLLYFFLALTALVLLLGYESPMDRLHRKMAEFEEIQRQNCMSTPEKAKAAVRNALDAWTLGDSYEIYEKKEKVSVCCDKWAVGRLVLLKYEINSVRPRKSSGNYPFSWDVGVILYLRTPEGIDIAEPVRIFVMDGHFRVSEISKLNP